MTTRLEAVDTQHPNLVAVVRGPLVLFAIGDSQPTFEHSALLASRRIEGTVFDWSAIERSGKPVMLRPFMEIAGESYSTYSMLA
jgi:hypothetical protein